ncbi:MAG: hypothetical protein Q9198_009264 [Flavoplaca austrocitrina]
MQHHPIFQRIQTNHQIRLQHRPFQQLILQPGNRLVEFIHHLHATPPQNLMPIRDTTRRPSFKKMTPPCQLRCIHYAAILTFAGSDKEDEPAALCDAGDDAAGAAEVGGGDVEGDDVDARADTENVAAVERVPEGCGVAEMGLGGEEERERDFGWRRRMSEEGMRGVMGSKRGAKVGGQGFYGDVSAGLKAMSGVIGILRDLIVIVFWCRVGFIIDLWDSVGALILEERLDRVGFLQGAIEGGFDAFDVNLAGKGAESCKSWPCYDSLAWRKLASLKQ